MNDRMYPPVVNAERQLLEYVQGRMCDRLPIETTAHWIKATIDAGCTDGPFKDALGDIAWNDSEGRILAKEELARKIHECFENVLARKPAGPGLEYELLVCFMHAWRKRL